MPEPNAFALSKQLTSLVNRKVQFIQAKVPPDTKVRQVYGIYKVFPEKTTLVVRADLELFGSFAGALVGLPESDVREKLKVSPVEEVLRDAMSEIFNVTASVVTTEGRAVFQRMAENTIFLEGDAQRAVTAPMHRAYFTVEIEGYKGGKYSVLEV